MKKIHWSLSVLGAGFLTHTAGGLLACARGEPALFGLSPGVVLVGSVLAALPFVVPATLQLSPDKLLVRSANLTALFLLMLSLASQTACFLQLDTDALAGLAFISLPILLAGLGVILLPTIYGIIKSGASS